MEQALALEHMDIRYAGQVGPLLHAFLDAEGLVFLGGIGSHIAAQLTDIGGGAKARDTHGVLILMLMYARYRLAYQHQVQQLGESGVVGAGAGHINNALLEANDLTGGNDCHAAEHMSLAGAYGVYLGDDAGEFAAGAFYLNTGFDYVLDRGDANALAGFGNVKMSVLYTGLNVVVSENEILGLVSVYEENAVFKL